MRFIDLSSSLVTLRFAVKLNDSKLFSPCLPLKQQILKGVA